MEQFCPHCEQKVTSPADGRCPKCLRILETIAEPETTSAPRSRIGLWTVAIALFAVAAGAVVWFAARPNGPGPVTQPQTLNLAEQLRKSGLTGNDAVPPGLADADLRKTALGAKDETSIDGLLRARVKDGKLVAVRPGRSHVSSFEPTSSLWKLVEQGLSNPVHPIEAAWLAHAMLEARGTTTEFVLETAGVQTPLVLSRLRVGVRAVGSSAIMEPFAAKPMVKPKVVSDDEAAAWWLVLRSVAVQNRGNFAQARSILAAAETIAPGHPAVAFARGLADMQQDMTDKGLATCEAALARAEDPLARVLLADQEMDHDQPVRAMAQADEALRRHPGIAEPKVTKAVLLVRRAPLVPEAQRPPMLDQAKVLLDQALAQDPEVMGARGALAEIALQRNDPKTADAVLREAMDKYGEVNAALALASLLGQQGRSDDAVSVLGRVPENDREEPWVIAMVQAWMATKKADQALEVAEWAWQRDPGHRTYSLLRAKLLSEVGRIEEAIAALEPLRNGIEGRQAMLLQAQLLVNNGKSLQAVPILEKARLDFPSDDSVIKLLMAGYARSNAPDKAEALAREAADQRRIPVLDLAEFFVQLGNMEAATRLLERAVKADLSDKQATTLLAVLYVATNRKGDAEKLRDQAVTAAGAGGEALRKAIDAAIVGTEADMKQAREAPQQAPAGEAP